MRAELRRKLAAIHPDRTGGSFGNTEQQERYGVLTDALELCDRTPSTSLIRVEEVPALVAAVRQAIAPGLSEQRAEYRALALGEIHQRFLMPRVSSAVFAAISAGLLAFSEQLNDNPVFAPLFNSTAARLAILAAFVYSGLFFVMTWLSEQRDAARVEWLSTEGGRRTILQQVISGRRGDQPSDTLRFRFSDVVEAIQSRRQRLLLPVFFVSRGISTATAETLAKLHLDELERRGVIRQSSQKRLDVAYEIDVTSVSDLALVRE